jgi:uncharacterized protein YfaA (DUF2138 family)
MSLQTQIGRNALDVLEVVKTSVVTEILEAKGRGVLNLTDQEVSELVRLVTGSIEKTFQNGLGTILAPLESQ